MGNIKSQKPSDATKDDLSGFAVRGWIPGWTLTALPDVLFHETAIPLGLACARLPGQFDVDIPGFKEPWTVSINPNAECRMSPHGIRMIEELDDNDIMVSVVKHDASTLLAEADDALLLPSLGPEAVITDSEASVTFNVGKHTLVFILQRSSTPARLVITTGTGETQRLTAKARSYLSISAHAQLDQLLTGQAMSADKPLYVVTPTDFLLSRFRPASPTLPYPWLANEEDEPAWRMECTYPAFRALLLTHSKLAAGMIGNLVEFVDGEGNVPLAGGHASPIFNGPPRCPMLITMIMAYFHQTRAWPINPAIHTRRLETYIKAISNAEPSDEVMYSHAVKHELIQWNEFVRQSGVSLTDQLHHSPNPIHHSAEQTESISALLDQQTPVQTRKTMATTLLESIQQHSEFLLSEENLVFIPDVLNELSDIDRSSLSDWVTTIRRQIAPSWQNVMANVTSPTAPTQSERLTLIGVCSWLEHWKSKDPEQHHQVAGWFNQHRFTLLASCGLLVALLAGFLFSVQFRSTMPLTVYETQMGMALQDYQTGNYPAAIETLEDIGRRGHQNNPINVFLLGKIYYRNKNYTEAIDAFQSVVKARPNSPAGYYNLGLSLFQHGEIEASKKVFIEMSDIFARTHPSSAARAVRAAEIVSRYEKTGDEAGFR